MRRADLVCAYKPQFAHYAAHAAENQLEHTIDYIKTRCPDAIVILDSKRGDIGSTAEQYAHEAFERYGADAVTVNPYLGRDSVEPFLKHARQGRHHPVPHLECRRARFPGSQRRARQASCSSTSRRSVAKEWNSAGNCMLVVGATYPEELADIRSAGRRSAVPGAGRRRTGWRCGQGHGGGQDRRRHRTRDQLIARDSLRELRRQFRGRRAQGRAGIARQHQRAPLMGTFLVS